MKKLIRLRKIEGNYLHENFFVELLKFWHLIMIQLYHKLQQQQRTYDNYKKLLQQLIYLVE